jgi:hypothetical protein
MINNFYIDLKVDLRFSNREVKTIEEKLNKYNMATLGEVPTQHEDRTSWILICQMGGCSGKEVRELKIAATERLINKYEVNLSIFMELNYSWATVDSSANLASWFSSKRERYGQLQFIIATRRRQDTNPVALVWCVDTSFSNMQGSCLTTSED